MAPRMLSSHHTTEQFCWKGVTGMVSYWSMWALQVFDNKV